jgi:preprotein translocase subunit SecA
MPIPVLDWFVRKTLGTRNQRMVRRYLRIVQQVNALEPTYRAMTDAQLREQTAEFRKRSVAGETTLGLIPDVFACAREAMDRAVGIRNVFNPALGFDPAALPEDVRALYESTRAAMEAESARDPQGDLRGCGRPVEPWEWMDIPTPIYEAVRALYPESRPPFRARPFDVQIIGGIVLSEGRIAEMKTGEGKTIVAPLACYLAACEAKSVHVVTVNDYLVQRDRDWTFPFFRALGLTVGAIHPMHMQSHEGKKDAYSCDVVYGTTAEFGFDYLRDNMKLRVEDQVQRRRDFAIVDEVDSILIDEARTPLIISGPAYVTKPRYDLANQLAKHLVAKQAEWNRADEVVQRKRAEAATIEGDIRNVRDRAKVPQLRKALDAARAQVPEFERARDRFPQFYEMEMDKKRATLTPQGIEEAQRVAGIGSFYVGANMDMPHLLEQSVRAHTVYERDRDYVVDRDEDGQMGVVIVDSFTGRKMVGRQWSDGLHQAVEAKEGVRIKDETQTMATITIQKFFKLYGRLAGMTGTADTEATEFHEIYGLDVISIPTNVPVQREDRTDLVYLAQKDKWDSVVEEIRRHHEVGRPVLVGTTSVEKSERLSRELQKRLGIPHEVLNAVKHDREAEIVAGAGQLGAVMIATNMAGRGTDIKLARITHEALLEHWKRRGIAPKDASLAAGEDACIARIWQHLLVTQAKMGREEAARLSPEEARRSIMAHWAGEHGGIEPEKAAAMGAPQLEAALDRAGWLLHRLRFANSTEALGGLHIIGTERHESRRIDNQLRGRAGRQGDLGSSRFFLALDDDLMKMFMGKAVLNVLSRLGMREGDFIDSPMVMRSVEKAQRKVEERNFQIRKNILEYDAPMEHQRSTFYGMRQPIVEGTGIREQVVRMVRESVEDAVDTYLSPLHVPRCITNWTFEAFGIQLEPDRFIGKDRDKVVSMVRTDTLEEAMSHIATTLGEYLPEDGDPEEWDAAGVAEWAQTTYGAQVPADVVRAGDSSAVKRIIEAAAQAQFEAVDLSPLEQYLVPDYGRRELAEWANRKFGITVDPASLGSGKDTAKATETIVREAMRRYERREIEYPIDFAMEYTTANMQANPQMALGQFCGWANARYEIGWEAHALPSANPAELRQLLVQRAESIDDAALTARAERMVAQAKADAEAAGGTLDGRAIAARMASDCLVALTPAEVEEAGRDGAAFVVRRLRALLRSELTQFERWVLLQVLDGAWKDHLLHMDQLRDAISFRSFSQKDPRIEFKREGARLFREMLESISDKATDLLLKGRLAPQMAQRPAPAVAPAAGAAMPAAGEAGAAQPGIGGGVAAADGTSSPAPAATGAAAGAIPASVPESPQERDIAIAERAGMPMRAIPVQAATAAPAKRIVGRNEPCPCGSGKKYKQCCGLAKTAV